MRRKLFLTYFALIILTLAAAAGVFWFKGYGFLDKQSCLQHEARTKLMAELFETRAPETLSEYEEFVTNLGEQYQVRLSLIDRNGTVVADSQAAGSLGRHDDREEVKKALEGEAASVKRYSDTMKMQYYYTAIPVETDSFSGVLRVSVPLKQLKDLTADLVGTVFAAMLFICLVALLIAECFSRYITRPLEEVSRAAEEIAGGNYGGRIAGSQGGELGRLSNAFNEMSEALRDHVDRLSGRNGELEAMLCSMNSAVVAIDDGNNILFYNEKLTQLMETGERDLTGQALYGIIRNALLFDVIDEVRKKGDSISKEGKLNLDGEKILRITGTPLHEKENKTLGVLLIIEDITELKKLETMRSDFVSNVTHELKTPLTSIRGFVDTLKNGAVKDEKITARFLDIIDIEAERLYHLIQDILLLSEIESGADYQVEACELHPIILEVIHLLEPKLGADVEILYHPEPYVRPYPCNRDRMKQLLINLVDNAIKNTEKGTIRITCRNEASNLYLEVADTGIGICEESLPRIFERFYRVDKGRSRKQGGTGLGLSIVKHIVEMYHGSIRVTSQLGEGTVFTVILPCQD